MPRPKEFDETEVLDRALELFRAQGFKQTSFDDLTRELEVSRQSLYDTYGDKSTLFHATLRRYLAGGLERMSLTLDNPAPVREVIAGLFEGIISANSTKNHAGCLMVNTMVELSPHDPEIRQMAAAHQRAIEGLLAGRLTAAQRQGEIAADRDPAALARFYYHLILGLAVAVRAFGEPESLRSSVQLALESLG